MDVCDEHEICPGEVSLGELVGDRIDVDVLALVGEHQAPVTERRDLDRFVRRRDLIRSTSGALGSGFAFFTAIGGCLIGASLGARVSGASRSASLGASVIFHCAAALTADRQ